MQIRVPAAAALLTAIVVALSGCGSTDDPSPTTPTQLDITGVNAEYSWSGLVGARGYSLTVDCADGTCTTTSVCHPMSNHATPAEPVTGPPGTVDLSLVQALGVIVEGTEPATEPSSVLERTDDYPDFAITLTTADGETLQVDSTSNTPSHVPWNLQRDGKLYVNSSPKFSVAYAALRSAVLGDTCIE